MADPNSPNSAQVSYWNALAGQAWRQQRARVDQLLDPLMSLSLDRLAPKAGEAVLDVGCGAGTSTLALARAVAPTGRVMGVDVSRVLLTEARERARSLPNVELREADAQVTALPAASFDIVYSRFGVMFFDDPEAAFTSLHQCLRPDGRLGFLCWRERDLNEWATVTLRAAQGLVDFPESAPDAPGPFAFARSERVCELLLGAGFDDVTLQALDHEMVQTLEDAIVYYQHIGPLGALLREASPDVADALRDALVRELRARAVDGELCFRSSAWWVSAVRG
ncbi:MAG: class I SAM-dependent methyltransferase [Polyangiaceae bacterium]|nr:class I SAM-dependent methyltransferase [Polyangiaceae bacterium]